MSRVAHLLSSVARNWRQAWFDVVLSAIAAGLAWLLASWAIGPQPVFAPIAAVIGLSPGVASRRRQTLGMLTGVAAGILVGGSVQRVGIPPLWGVPAVTAAAMLAVSAIGLDAVMVIQAGASALVVVGSGLPGTSSARLADAVIGAAVALAFSQALFSADPVRVLRSAAASLADAAEDLAKMPPDQRTGSAAPMLSAVTALANGFTLLGEARRWTLAGRLGHHGQIAAEQRCFSAALPLAGDALRVLAGEQVRGLADRARGLRVMLAGPVDEETPIRRDVTGKVRKIM